MEVKTSSRHDDIYSSVSHASDRSMPGSIHDTSVALQHDIADVPDHAVKVCVVRRPTPWFYGQIDENVPELGPPEAVLDTCKERATELEEQGMDDADALDQVWVDTGSAERYREHLAQSDEAQETQAAKQQADPFNGEPPQIMISLSKSSGSIPLWVQWRYLTGCGLMTILRRVHASPGPGFRSSSCMRCTC